MRAELIAALLSEGPSPKALVDNMDVGEKELNSAGNTHSDQILLPSRFYVDANDKEMENMYDEERNESGFRTKTLLEYSSRKLLR